MRRGQLTLLLAAGLVLAAASAHAQSSLGIGSAEVTAQPGSGLLGDLFRAINTYQRAFFVDLRQALIGLKEGGQALPLLVGLSFAYGVFHAAGPGHGKAVISSYVLADAVELRRGIAVSFASSLVQALSALLLVGAAYLFLRGTAVTLTGATTALEIGSYALVAGFGAWLLARKLARAWRERVPAPVAGLAFAAPGRAVYGLDFAAPATGPAARLMRPASGGFSAEVCAAEDPDDCDCGKSHMPSRALVSSAKRFTPGAALSAVLAVGLRPCSGAIVVLTFALVNGLWLGGLLSVLAMAMGTAITVSIIAAVAVWAKGFALKAGSGTRSRRVLSAIEILGAALVLLLGLALLGGALQGGF